MNKKQQEELEPRKQERQELEQKQEQERKLQEEEQKQLEKQLRNSALMIGGLTQIVCYGETHGAI